MTYLRYAYGSRGLAHTGLEEGLALLAGAGYDGVALALPAPSLHPAARDAAARADRLRDRLDALCLEVVVEPGTAGPSLVSAQADDRARRVTELRRACDLAEVLRAETVTVRTGCPAAGVDPAQAWAWLVEGLGALVQTHGDAAYALAVQPGPGTPVADVAAWSRLSAQVPVALVLDTAAVPAPVADTVRALRRHLGAVAVGEGHDGLAEVLGALVEAGYDGMVTVDRPADSARAAELVPAVLAGLDAAEARAMA